MDRQGSGGGNVLIDAGTDGTRVLRRVPASYRPRTYHHCDVLCDTAQHTLADCAAWSAQRRALTGVVGEDLSLPILVTRMAGSEAAWRAIVAFCKEVMRETAERIRRQKVAAPTKAATAVAGSDKEGETEEKDNGGDDSTPPPFPPIYIRRSRRIQSMRVRGTPSPSPGR